MNSKTFIFGLFAKGIGALASTIFTLFIAYWFGKEVSGDIFWFVSIVIVVSVSSRMGFDLKVYRELGAILKFQGTNEAGRFIAEGMLGQGALLLLASILTALALYLNGIFLNGFIIAVIFWGLGYLVSVYLRVVVSNHVGLLFENSITYVLFVLFCLFATTEDAKLDLNFAGQVFLLASISSLLIGIAILKAHTKLTLKVQSLWHGYYSYGGGIGLLVFGYNQLPVIIGGWISPADLSEVVISIKIMLISGIGLMAISSYVQPRFGAAFEAEDYVDLEKLYLFSLKSALATCVPFFIFICLLITYIPDEMLGEYSNIPMFLCVLMPGYFMSAFSGAAGEFLVMVGETKRYFYLSLFTLLISVIVTYFLADILGGVGILIAVSLSMCFQNLILIVFVLKKMKYLKLKNLFLEKVK